jgi:hypothetical protein
MKYSKVQGLILQHLARSPIDNIALFACSIGKHRSSISRSLHLLESRGFVSQDGPRGTWRLACDGRKRLESSFRRASDITWIWGNLVAGISCPCGEEVVVDEEEIQQCGCGRTYRLRCTLDVKGA